MSINTIEVLNGSGHLTLKWDAENETETASIREEVAQLKEAGYSFFLVDGTPADEVTAGHGDLLVRRVEDPVSASNPEGETAQPKKRGPKPGGTRTVAVRPMAGGS